MGRNVVPSGTQVNGRAIKRMASAMFAAYGSLCHLCGGPGATTIDHLVPVSLRPDLRWTLENVRPAHLRCNSKRRDAPLRQRWSAPGW